MASQGAEGVDDADEADSNVRGRAACEGFLSRVVCDRLVLRRLFTWLGFDC